MTRTHARLLGLLVLACGLGSTGCATAPRTPAARRSLHQDVLVTIERFKQRQPQLQPFFDDAEGYAVFPSVAKGGMGVGGAYGRGEVFEREQLIGHCDLSQGTIGFQLGGQVYSEIIFFDDAGALGRFKTGNFAFAARASAVALQAGASADADYEHGVAVFTMTRGGLMYEATIGGQKFTFRPIGVTERDAISSADPE